MPTIKVWQLRMFIQTQIVLSPNVHLFLVNCIRFVLEDHGTFKITLYWRILHHGGLINLAKDIHNICIFRDTKHVYGSPLFRHHYECPTNPSLMHHVEQDAWWDINHREDDCFLDSDKYGYIASQLTHIPQLIGYDYGNVLT